MSGSPASWIWRWSGGDPNQVMGCRPKNCGHGSFDFGSVAIWRDSGLYLDRAPIHGRVVAAALRRLRAAAKAAAATAWAAWWEPVLPAATTGDTRVALMVIIVAPSSRLVAAAGHEKT